MLLHTLNSPQIVTVIYIILGLLTIWSLIKLRVQIQVNEFSAENIKATQKFVTGSVDGEKTLNNKLINDTIRSGIGVPFIIGISAFKMK